MAEDKGTCPTCGHTFITDEEINEVHENDRRGDESIMCGNCNERFSVSYGGGGCFLTTAAVTHQNRDDDCRELTLMRQLRDNYLLDEHPNGQQIVDHYYEIAPEIVAEIRNDSGSDEQLDSIWETVCRIADDVDQGELEAATRKYRSMVQSLKDEYYPKAPQ